MKNYNGRQIIDNAMKYGENIGAYGDYLNLIAYLIKVLSLPQDVISASITLKMLTMDGIFTKDGNLKIESGISNDIVGFWGMHVVHGIASCRHIANFQSDVINRNFLISEPFYCFLANCDFKNVGNISINHAINLIQHNGIYYGYDATNDKLFRFVDHLKMMELFTENPSYAYFKPQIKLGQNGMEIANIKYDINLFDEMANKDGISEKEYNYIRDYAQRSFESNKELFDDFRESSKKYIKKITKGIK